MPQEPKRRHSRQRKGKRRSSIQLQAVRGVLCPNCKQLILPHTICKNCGYYDGRPVLVFKEKNKKEEKTS